jgi:hypothetical protein
MDANYASVVGVGFNLNQAQTGTNPALTVAAGSTITVGATLTDSTTNTGNGFARIQVVDNASPPNNYCVDAGAWTSETPIPVENFNTHCWNTSEAGALALSAGTQLVSVHITVPSDKTTDRPFSVCLTDFAM